MSENVEQFYDDYAPIQKERGINRRHRCIMRWLEMLGLRSNSHVLEIGCGVGTQTELIASVVRSGKIVANDISSKSISLAKERLQRLVNIEFLVGDIVQLPLKGTFDMIVLPDVLEHIPMASHEALFRKLSKLLTNTGRIVIHIPSPEHIEWLTKNRPETLQVIDQAIHLHDLAPKARASGLYVSHYQYYRLWSDVKDAVVIVLEHSLSGHAFRDTPPEFTLWERIKGKAERIFS